jgi:hypothetical protein
MTKNSESLPAEADVSEDVDETGTRSTVETQRISVLRSGTVGCGLMETLTAVSWRTLPRTDSQQCDVNQRWQRTLGTTEVENDRGISDIYGVLLMLGVALITVFLLGITVGI